MIGHYKHILFVGINDIDALASKETSLFTISRIKVCLSFGMNKDSNNNLLFFMIRHHKHILLIWINDFAAFVSKEKLLFLRFLELKLIFQLG